MQPLSATECITPAMDRTKLVLFSPFRKGRTWKLCATSYLAIAGQMFAPFPLLYLVYMPVVERLGTWAVYALIAGVTISSALYFVLFYLCSRIKFAYFDIVLHCGQFVAPAWRKYGAQSLSWTWFKIGFGSVVTLAMSVPIITYTRHIVPIFLSIKPGQPPPANLFASLMAGYGLILLIFGSFALVSGLLGDFIVPSLALEDTGLAEAFRRMWELMRSEPGEFLLYVLLKTVLGGIAYFGATIAFEIALLLILLFVSVILGIVGFVLHLAGIPTPILFAIGITLGVACEVFLLGYGLLLTLGPVLNFLDAYALYFLGGRYPLLGDLLDRSTPPPALPYGAAYPPYLPSYPPSPPPPPF